MRNEREQTSTERNREPLTAARGSTQGSHTSAGIKRLRKTDADERLTEARRHGIAPAPFTHPAYPFMPDGNGGSVVCEQITQFWISFSPDQRVTWRDAYILRTHLGPRAAS